MGGTAGKRRVTGGRKAPRANMVPAGQSNPPYAGRSIGHDANQPAESSREADGARKNTGANRSRIPRIGDDRWQVWLPL